MTTLSIYMAVNACEAGGRWSCYSGQLRKRFQCYADFENLPFFQRKKTLLNAVKTMDDGNYDVRGRSGRYTVCERDSGKPVWVVCAG